MHAIKLIHLPLLLAGTLSAQTLTTDFLYLDPVQSVDIELPGEIQSVHYQGNLDLEATVPVSWDLSQWPSVPPVPSHIHVANQEWFPTSCQGLIGNLFYVVAHGDVPTLGQIVGSGSFFYSHSEVLDVVTSETSPGRVCWQLTPHASLIGSGGITAHAASPTGGFTGTITVEWTPDPMPSQVACPGDLGLSIELGGDPTGSVWAWTSWGPLAANEFGVWVHGTTWTASPLPNGLCIGGTITRVATVVGAAPVEIPYTWQFGTNAIQYWTRLPGGGSGTTECRSFDWQ